MKFKYLKLVIVGLILPLSSVVNANLIVGISDTLSGVIFEWSGSIDTSNLSSSGPFNNSGGVQSNSSEHPCRV